MDINDRFDYRWLLTRVDPELRAVLDSSPHRFIEYFLGDPEDFNDLNPEVVDDWDDIELP